MDFAGPGIKRQSAWSWNTSGTGGAGLGLVAASGGAVVLNDPAKQVQRFHYAAGGVGLSAGIRKIPKIGKIVDPRSLSNRGGGNVAPEFFTNHGTVYVMDGCSRDELVREDFHGICAVYDVGAGIIVGYSGALMLVGLDPLALAARAALAANPITNMLAPRLRVKAMILSHGWNTGPQAGAGITGQLGYIWPTPG